MILTQTAFIRAVDICKIINFEEKYGNAQKEVEEVNVFDVNFWTCHFLTELKD